MEKIVGTLKLDFELVIPWILHLAQVFVGKDKICQPVICVDKRQQFCIYRELTNMFSEP